MSISQPDLPVHPPAPRLRRFAQAFEVPGFRWLWLAALLTWSAWIISTLSQGWLMLQLTDSPFWVGLAVGLRGACQTLSSVPAGAVADRVDRRRILLVATLLGAASVAAVAVLTLAGAVRPWHLLAFMGLKGLLSAVERPSSAGLLYDLVGPQRLLNASAFRFMGSSVVHTLSALASGAVLQALGSGYAFLLAGAAYLGGFVCLLVLAPPAAQIRTLEAFGRTVSEGFRYAVRTRGVRLLLILSLIVEGFGFAYIAMLPVIARDVLNAGGLGLGYLMAMSGVGTFVATVVLASRGDVRGRLGLLTAAAIGFGILVMLFGLSRALPLSLLLVMVAHMLGTTYDVSIYTALPLAASDAMRGRVLGFYASTLGFSQLGGLAVGAVATLLGAPAAVAITGGLTAVGSVLLRWRILQPKTWP